MCIRASGAPSVWCREVHVVFPNKRARGRELKMEVANKMGKLRLTRTTKSASSHCILLVGVGESATTGLRDASPTKHVLAYVGEGLPFCEARDVHQTHRSARAPLHLGLFHSPGNAWQDAAISWQLACDFFHGTKRNIIRSIQQRLLLT